MQPGHLSGVQGSGLPDGRQPRPPQRLVDQQVAEPGHPALVQQPGLERHRRAGQGLVQLSPGSATGRQAPGPARRGRAARRRAGGGSRSTMGAATLELQPEAVPGRFVARAVVEQVVDGHGSVHHDLSCHAERAAPAGGPSVSTITSLPMRRTVSTRAPVSSRRRASVEVPPFANHSSGAWTREIVRPLGGRDRPSVGLDLDDLRHVAVRRSGCAGW